MISLCHNINKIIGWLILKNRLEEQKNESKRHIEETFDRLDQFVDAVTDFRASGDAGDREVFANLDAALPEFLGDARARNDVVAAVERFF